MSTEDPEAIGLSLQRGEDAVHGPLVEFARAKVNLSLAVKGLRSDGHHELASLVAFASVGDELALTPDDALSLTTKGPFAAASGSIEANLVLKAAEALARRVRGLKFGAFSLKKNIPVGAGLGGGSVDAAAALRLLARANGLPHQDPAIVDAAAEVGSDVPVCLMGGCRLMRGRGETLGPTLFPPSWHAVLVNPGLALSTARVFGAFATLSAPKPRSREFAAPDRAGSRREWLAAIAACGNDLEEPAIGLAPRIEAAKRALMDQQGCLLARMTGSGPTLFGIFGDAQAGQVAANSIAATEPGWWVRETTLAS